MVLQNYVAAFLFWIFTWYIFMFALSCAVIPAYSPCLNLFWNFLNKEPSANCVPLTCHWQLRLGWAWGWFWKQRLPSNSVPLGCCCTETPGCPSSPNWHLTRLDGLALSTQYKADYLEKKRQRQKERACLFPSSCEPKAETITWRNTTKRSKDK